MRQIDARFTREVEPKQRDMLMSKTWVTLASVAAYYATTALAWAGTGGGTGTVVDNDNNAGAIILLVLLGAVVVAAGAKGKAKPIEEGEPTIIDDDAAGGNGKY